MSKIEELISKRKELNAQLDALQRYANADTVGVGYCGTTVGLPAVQLRIRPRLKVLLQAAVDEVAGELNEINDLFAKAEAALNPPEPETFYNTPNKWFEWNECDPNLMEDVDDCISVAVCSALEWQKYVDSGKQDELLYYGNDNGTQCVSQIIDAVNDINAGLEVSGDPTNAVIVVKWSK